MTAHTRSVFPVPTCSHLFPRNREQHLFPVPTPLGGNRNGNNPRNAENATSCSRPGSTPHVTIPAPKNPTRLVDCPRGCGATVHRTDWDDNHGFYVHARYIDPQPLTQPETIACIIAGRPIHTWRTDRHGRHWHGHPSRWHPSQRHAPAHHCNAPFPTPPAEPEPFEPEQPPTTACPF